MKMKLRILIILISLFFSVNKKSYSQIPEWSWAKQVSGIGIDYDGSIAVDAFGNVYTTGGYQGTRDFDPGVAVFNLTSAGSADIFISKLNSSGNLVWAKRMGGTGWDDASSIVLDQSGNIYITGSFNGVADFDPDASGVFNLASSGFDDIFVSKIDSAGNLAWAKRMGGTNQDGANSIAIDSAGSIYTIGVFNGTCDFDPGSGTFNLYSGAGSGSEDAFISKLNNSGNFIWAKSIGAPSSNGIVGPNSLTLDASANLYATGSFQNTVDFDPGPGVYNLTSTTFNLPDLFISKLDSSGNFVWVKQIGGNYYQEGLSITTDQSDNVYITGIFEKKVDFDPGVGVFYLTSAAILDYDVFVLKLDHSGNFVWAKRIGGNEDDRATSIALDAAGNVYTTGYFMSKVDFDPGPGKFNLQSKGSSDAFISKLDDSGHFLWAKSVGGGAYEEGKSLVTDVSGNVYLSGLLKSDTVFFGTNSLTGNGRFVAKLNQKPCNTITCTISPTIKISNVSSNSCNNGIITVHLNGTFQAFAHIELYDSLNTMISSVNVSPGILNHEFNNLSPGSYTVKVFDNNCCENDIPALVKCSSLTTGLKTTNIKTTSAKLNWKIASCVVSYRVQYRIKGNTTWNNRYVSGSQGYRTIVNLTPSTDYEWRIANMCYGSNIYPINAASSIQTFTTLDLPITQNVTDVLEAKSFEINLFPNPATYTLTVNFETEEASARLKVINTVGQVVYEKQLQTEDGSYEEQVDISKYNNGIYILLVQTDNSSIRKKFAKE